MFSVLKSFLGVEQSPNKVLEVKNDCFAELQVLHRDESMRLYQPNFNNARDKNLYFEIVIERPHSETINTSYSLYRAKTIEEAEEKFTCFFQRLPIFVKMVREMYTINGLQKICDILVENPSWSLAHLIAHFNIPDYISNPLIVESLDYPDHDKLMTPIQVAIKAGNIEFVKALVCNCKLEHLDNNSNSVFHYAASTTKEMINLLTSKNTTNLNHSNIDGYTPLHLACLADKPDCVKALLLAGADANKMAKSLNGNYHKVASSSNVADFLQTNANKLYTQDMKFGGTPLHWSNSREVLNSLIKGGCDVNLVNFKGQTPLHIMVQRNRLECVVALLSHECEIDIEDNDGNTPLHIAVDKKFVPIVQCLVVFGCDLNKPNRDGNTPRHMVGKDASGSNDDMILYILHSVGAKRCPENNARCPPGCNFKGHYNGIPPAQPEMSEQREHIQEMLAATSSRASKGSFTSIMANAASNAMKANEQSKLEMKPIDTSKERKGATLMDALMSMFTQQVVAESVADQHEDNLICIDDGESDAMSTEHNNREQHPGGRGRLLCLDGGGIRGLVLAQMLLEIETLSHTPIHHLFDWIAGTSTGGILALALGYGNTMKQCMCLYLRMKDTAFVGSRPYPSEPLENVLKENLGEFTVMTDIKYPRLMVTGVMADRKPVDLHIFRNYECASDILGFPTPINSRRIPPPRPCDQLVWQAARASGAAPSYFRAFGRFLDGGLIANNPTLDAMTEIHEYNMALKSIGKEFEAVPISVVVSLGTGLIPVTEMKEIDVFRPDNMWDTVKLAYGISAIGNLLVDQATASDGRVVDRARAWCSMIGIPYFRFNPQMSVDLTMDEKMDEPLINMMWETKAYCYANRKKIMEMINLLK